MGTDNSGGLTQWLADHPWITYLFIVVCMIYIFNAVFRPRKLPLLKDVIVYALILLGGWLLLFFQTKVGLPIVHGFAVAILLMLTVSIRSWITRRGRRDTTSHTTGEKQESRSSVQQVRAIQSDETDR